MEPLWRFLYEHHSEISTGGVPFLPADERWPARLTQFEQEFDADRALLLIAEDAKGRPIGFTFSRLEGPDDIFATGPVAEVETIVVDPEHRGEGLGQRLMRETLDRLRGMGAETVKLVVVAGNEPALRLYERMGIRPALLDLYAPLNQIAEPG
jgi:ribosomal protein S18 acetylase RimI-like enzyme